MAANCLALATPPEWAAHAERHMPTLLLDHAHCEKRAASTALNFIFRYPSFSRLIKSMTSLCREEMQHFAQVLAILERRGIEYRAQVPSRYAPELMRATRGPDPGRLVDHLLAGALIEARSCERFEVLAAGLQDQELADFFGRLAQAEARHYEEYLELARATGEPVDERFSELILAEARAAALPMEEPRLHGSFGLLVWST